METHELAPSERRCEQCEGELQAAGSEDSEVLEVEVRAYRRLIKRKRYRRTCQCTGARRVVTAAAPPRLIPKGILGISIWVTVLIDKYRLYRPTYRLLEALRIHGLDLALGTVTDGLKRLAPLFVPLREALRARSRTADHWHADETSWYVFEATGEDARYRWCLWVFWCREAVVFKLDRTRSARVPKEHFAGVAGGTVSADRYSSYKRLAKDTAVVIAYCWAHVRRDFIAVADQWEQHQEWAEEWLGLIAELYRLNKERLLVLSDPGQYAAAEAALRAAISAMQQRWERELAQPQLHHAPKKVLTSLRNHWSGLILFVEHPAIPMDNNQAERALRGPVVGRKNYYGSGALWSGELTATLFSLFHTLELWQINPHTWLTEYLSACAAAGSRVPADFERFLPWNRIDGKSPRTARPAAGAAAPRGLTLVRYCGREFSAQEMELIRSIIAEDPSRHRLAISRVVCERLDWRRLNGELKDMSCRVAMLRMHRDGLIRLPAPQGVCYNGRRRRRRTPQAEPQLPITGSVQELPAWCLRPVTAQADSRLWCEYVDRYHYLGYTPLAGAQLRYLVISGPQVLAVLGFAASAWKVAPRDQFIGWNPAQREARLHLVVNNARFLILPWVQVKNLASCLLARSCRRLPADWLARYGYRPLLLETFVQSDRFAGTCYRAANWTHVGETQGRGKLDVHNQRALPKKDIWLYPLQRDFRRRLCAPLDPQPNP